MRYVGIIIDDWVWHNDSVSYLIKISGESKRRENIERYINLDKAYLADLQRIALQGNIQSQCFGSQNLLGGLANVLGRRI